MLSPLGKYRIDSFSMILEVFALPKEVLRGLYVLTAKITHVVLSLAHVK